MLFIRVILRCNRLGLLRIKIMLMLELLGLLGLLDLWLI